MSTYDTVDVEVVSLSANYDVTYVATSFDAVSLSATSFDAVSLSATNFEYGQFILLYSITDTSFIDDSISIVASYQRSFADTSAVSDDAALTVNSRISDVYSVSDTEAATFGKYAVDSATISDDFSLVAAYSRRLVDVASAADNLTYLANYVRRISDGSSVVDTAVLSAGLAHTDSSLTTDTTDITFNKTHGDVAAAGDIFSSQGSYNRAFDETADVAELISKEVARAASDQAFVSELIQTILAVGRSIADASIMTDSSISLLGKTRTDTGTVLDTGSLRSQGYVDFSYFAEDYVGESRTFT